MGDIGCQVYLLAIGSLTRFPNSLRHEEEVEEISMEEGDDIYDLPEICFGGFETAYE
ncbi:hypothetical protein HanIR_Chr07g0305911 [Helianthus annuus]|nr:hypothetical protein HanIR_Chr07g0305911 [Helianthus annuus]